jgi:hypothetical protein
MGCERGEEECIQKSGGKTCWKMSSCKTEIGG